MMHPNAVFPPRLAPWMQKSKRKCINGCGRTVFVYNPNQSGRCRACANRHNYLKRLESALTPIVLP